jgi:predicted metal-dependent HD superfamily phosphohydrolase
MFINFRTEISQENALYIEKLLDKHDLREIWSSADMWYSLHEYARGYHNINHASKVVNNIFAICPEPPLELLMAAMWHDAIYIPGAGGDVNEKASSAAMMMAYNRRLMNGLRVDSAHAAPIMKAAKILIDGTCIEMHFLPWDMTKDLLDRGFLPYLVDADLSSLADDWDSFLASQSKIINENYGDVNNPENLKKCAEFLRKFLYVRNNIYHTPKARELWEDKARANIQRLINETGA